MLYVFLFQNDRDYLTDEEFIESSDDDANPEEAQFMKKRKKSAKRGRKCLWSEIAVTDLVDIILENEKYKTKLLLTNTKNVKNGVYYDQVITELKKRFEERDEEFTYNVPQTRSKFKRCVSICRKAALTIKTASGIKRFQEEKEFGPWFQKLCEAVCTMDNCQPEQSIEPHVSKESIEEEPEGKEENKSENDGSSISTPMESTSKGSGKKRKSVFVPEIKAKKKQVLARTFDHLSKTLANLTDAIRDDSS